MKLKKSASLFGEKISALRQKLAQSNAEELQFSKKPETLKYLFKIYLLDFFKLLLKETSEADDLFLKKDIHWSTDNETFENLKSLESFFESLTENNLPRYLRFNLTFSGLKKGVVSNFKYVLYFECLFFDLNWKIHNSEFEREYQYHEVFLSKDQTYIIDLLAEYLHDLIENNSGI